MKNGYSICLNEWALDKEIKNELGLLLIISSLCAENGYCFASNSYFANLFNETEQSISRKIKLLENKLYINIEYEKRGCEIKSRRIRLTKLLIHDKQNCYSTINKNVKDNNTSINNTSINNTPYNPPKGENKKINEELFNKLWNEYPKKKSKGNVEKWFEKNKPSEDLINLMIDKLKLLKTTEQWTKKNGQFIPYPTTWLNAKGWEDEVTTDSSIPEWFDKKIEEKNVSDLEEEEFLKKIKEARGE